jgi:regulator of protease activity HflC (stomatin/prohibitin superfamily)
MDTIFIVAIIILLTAVLVLSAPAIARKIAQSWGFLRVTIQDSHVGLKYHKGRLLGVVEPGQHWYNFHWTSFDIVDTRLQYTTIAGQEILTSDAVSIKVSIAAAYQITDPVKSVTVVTSCEQAFYLEVQLVLREIVGALTIDDLLAQRNQIGQRLLDRVAPKAAVFGLTVSALDIKDIMFPGALRDTFAKVVTAQKEGLAALERARGESAALRSLANAARMLDDNPGLLQLRLIQALSESSGNTLVLGSPADLIGRGAASPKDKPAT